MWVKKLIVISSKSLELLLEALKF